MKQSVRRLVRLRAGGRCEYCRVHEFDEPLFSFQIEHIVAKKHHGTDDPGNLAWSCLEIKPTAAKGWGGRCAFLGLVAFLAYLAPTRKGVPATPLQRNDCQPDTLDRTVKQAPA